MSDAIVSCFVHTTKEFTCLISKSTYVSESICLISESTCSSLRSKATFTASSHPALLLPSFFQVRCPGFGRAEFTVLKEMAASGLLPSISRAGFKAKATAHRGENAAEAGAGHEMDDVVAAVDDAFVKEARRCVCCAFFGSLCGGWRR